MHRTLMVNIILIEHNSHFLQTMSELNGVNINSFDENCGIVVDLCVVHLVKPLNHLISSNPM